jgi:hypothetical protein
MTPDEKQLLQNFLRDLTGARGQQKDAEADALINQALGQNPDAAYLLVQHAIVADQSLHAAQARIAELERQNNTPPASSSFLPQGSTPWSQGSGYGGNIGAGGWAPPPPAERPGIFSGGGGLGSFLRNAGTTAAGVAGGEMLFNGLSDLFGGGHRGGFGGGGENVVVNNFIDDDGDYGPGDPAGW